LETQVQQWGLAQEIRFLGVRSDVPRLMLGADVLLFPSVAEGLGMVVVEAQAAALPVLASDTTPSECVVVPEMVRFLPISASSETWAAAALRIMESGPPDPLICNARVRDSAFSIENSGARLLQLYTGGKHPSRS
jgi:glycosyltransferase involved in cell wall biosynthesis